MNNHYGELDGSVGYDGDPIDVFVGENPDNGNTFVIDQIDPETGKFDESKVMLGFDTAEQAKAAYLSNYEQGWKGFGSITPSGDNFKKWLYDGAKQRKPFADYKDTPAPVAPELTPEQKPETKPTIKEIADASKGQIIIGKPAATSQQPTYGAANKIFTEDAAAKAREILRRKLGNLNAGIDPEMMMAGIQLAGYHVEAGARKFTDYAKVMIEDIGEGIKPYLKSFYNSLRTWPEFDNTGMDSANDVDNFDLDKKEEILLNFFNGEIAKLITKPKITAFGLNWQHCNHTVYFPTFSYEQYYQSIRRFWRFGQTKPVIVDLVYSEGQKRVLDSILAKTKKADELFSKLNSNLHRDYTIVRNDFNKQISLPNFITL